MLLAVLTIAAAAAAAAAPLPRGSETVHLEPAEFSTTIDNPYWPMKPGSRWVYRETDSEGTKQKVVVTVTNETKLIANGVTARVVRDVVTEKGKSVEVTEDWYAQDRRGNIWYLGEATTEYENGKPVSTAGSFEAGVDGAQAGVIMPARPAAGPVLPAGVLQGPRGGRSQHYQPARAGRGSLGPLPSGADDARRQSAVPNGP